jgi:hypothetical protein
LEQILQTGLFGAALLEDHWLVSSASQSEQIKGTPSAMNLAAPRTLFGSFFAPVNRLPRRRVARTPTDPLSVAATGAAARRFRAASSPSLLEALCMSLASFVE